MILAVGGQGVDSERLWFDLLMTWGESGLLTGGLLFSSVTMLNLVSRGKLYEIAMQIMPI